MRPEHPRRRRIGPRHRRADAAVCRQQVVTRRGDRGREQRRGAVARMEPGHPPHRIRAGHDVGAGAAVDVQIDEARQHEPVSGRIRRRLDRLDRGGAAQPAAHEATLRQDLAGERGRAHGFAPIASRALIR
jgi:hypothetical protein